MCVFLINFLSLSLDDLGRDTGLKFADAPGVLLDIAELLARES